jgi:Holliday junction resolvase RusA-like endonuclease
MQIELTILGDPAGKGRPRFVRATGRAYTDAKTISAEQAVVEAWHREGQGRLPDVALSADITVCMQRPKGHFKRDGGLSAEGQRQSVPTKRPDLDNVAKLVLDSLNGLAYRDDSQIAQLIVHRFWTDSYPRVTVRLTDINPTEEPC